MRNHVGKYFFTNMDFNMVHMYKCIYIYIYSNSGPVIPYTWWHTYTWKYPHLILYTARHYPYSKIHGANMGPTWVLSAPDGPHVGPMNLAIRVLISVPHWVGITTLYVCKVLNQELGISQMSLIARFMGPTCGPSGADRTQVGPMLAPSTLLSGVNLVQTNFSK